MKIDDNFVLREIAGEYIIIPVGATSLKFNGLITVNEVGALLWDMLQKDVSMEELVQGVLAEYNAQEDVVREDIKEFLEKLVDDGILDLSSGK